MLNVLRERLEQLADRSLNRSLTLPAGIDFSSNDYLGLAVDPELAARCATAIQAVDTPGTASSRLLRGHRDIHSRFEQQFARFKGNEAALLYPSGYQANVGLLTALIGESDRALSDAGNHASLIDGMRLSRCRKVIFPHLDVGAVETALREPHPGGRTFLVTESLFSMDGDCAPLTDYVDLVRRHEAALIVDDAHATGLYGSNGGGLVSLAGIQAEVLATTSTLGKAFGLSGGIVTGAQSLIDYLVNSSRSFIFSTAVPPLLVAACEAALELVRQPQRRTRLHRNARMLRRRLAESGIVAGGHDSPIIPIIIGDNQRALEAASRLQSAGLDVRAVRPPTVPEGTARLRVSVHACHSDEEIERLTVELVRVCQSPSAFLAGQTP